VQVIPFLVVVEPPPPVSTLVSTWALLATSPGVALIAAVRRSIPSLDGASQAASADVAAMAASSLRVVGLRVNFMIGLMGLPPDRWRFASARPADGAPRKRVTRGVRGRCARAVPGTSPGTRRPLPTRARRSARIERGARGARFPLRYFGRHLRIEHGTGTCPAFDPV